MRAIWSAAVLAAIAAISAGPDSLRAETVLRAGVSAPVRVVAASETGVSQELALRLSGRGGAVAAAYAARAHAPIWLPGADAGAEARRAALMAALAEAETHALPPARYGRAALMARAAELPADAAARAELDLALTEAFLLYARDVSSGVLEPNRVDRELHHAPARPDEGALLSGLLAADDPAAMIEALPPATPEYARLRRRLAHYLALAREAEPWHGPLSGGESLRTGDRSGRVAALRARLEAIGDLEPLGDASGYGAIDPEADGAVLAANDVVTDTPVRAEIGEARLFDSHLARAVREFQARHGLNRDGVVGPATRAALNASPAERARQIAVNLERLRWFNRDLGRRHVMVNLAGFEMALVEDGARIFESRVVVGKSSRHRTPEFSDEMEYMVINPTWHVPASIAREEILPKLQADPTYLARNNMRLEGAGIPAEEIEWSFVTPSSFPGRVKQGPGAGNALGKVKFMFPNRFAVYLHDTPKKSLFRRDRRTFSHGCVRVQEPFEFAYHLLGAQEDDPQGFFHAILERGRERYVPLREHVPVHLTYRTAWVDAAGTDHFREDVYGRDARVFAALEGKGLELFAR